MESALDRVLIGHIGSQDLGKVNNGRCLRVMQQGPRLQELAKLAELDPTLKIVELEPREESAVCRSGLYGVFRVPLDSVDELTHAAGDEPLIASA